MDEKLEGNSAPLPPPEGHVQIECPHCHVSFWHKVKSDLEQAGEGLGDAIGEAKFGV